MDITEKRVKIVALRKERLRLEGKLMEKPTVMLPGPLTVRYARCGKGYCHCHKKGAKGHGPYHYVQVKVKGKYTNIYLGKNQGLIEEAKHYSEYVNNIVALRRINREIDGLLVEISQAKMKKGVKA